jgi:hypothetical protein
MLELGYSFSFQQGGFYVLYDKNKNHFLTVRLTISEQPSFLIHGSKNGIDIQAIGLFKINQPLFDQGPDFYIFIVQNSYNQRIEYLIIPNDEFMKRLNLRKFETERKRSLRLVFWLLPDNSIYDTTRISPEGEWYFLSKGVNGRMADKTDMNYTMFLNNWRNMMLR